MATGNDERKVPPLLRHTTARLGKKQLLELYRHLLVTRRTEDRLSALYRQGRLPGGLFRSLGQEAVPVGCAFALEKDDLIGPLLRDLGALVVRGVTPREIFAQYLGRADSPTFGRDTGTHFGDLSRGIVAPIAALGSNIAVLAGGALSFRLRGQKRVAVTFIGDGGTSTGDFHEGLNLAAVWKLPLIVVIENNGYAYSTPTAQQTRNTRLAERAKAYGIRGEQVDGNDVIAVVHATARAARRCRRGEGPVLLEMITFRRKGHAEHDAASYVPPELLEYWEARDPLRRLEAYLVEEGLYEAADLRAVDESITAEVEKASEEALAAPWPDPSLAFGGVWAEEPDPRRKEGR